MNIRETYSVCGHSKLTARSTREKAQGRCPECRYNRGMAIVAKAILVFLAALVATLCVAKFAKGGESGVEHALRSLPVYFEDRADPELKATQLADMATAIEQAAEQHRPPGVKVKDWEATLITVAFHESTNSLRIHQGLCKPHECDSGRARGPWQQHRNGRTEDDWNALIGLEHTGFQAETASVQLRRGFLNCKGSPAPWLQGTLNNYAGKNCNELNWDGLEDRLQTWTKVRARL